MTAVLASSDFRRLRDLADRWRGQRRSQPADDLHSALDEIEARRAEGGDVLEVIARGNSVPEIHADALAKAAELWGPAAQLEVESTDTVIAADRPGYPAFRASVCVRCLNYAEVSSTGRGSLTGGAA